MAPKSTKTQKPDKYTEKEFDSMVKDAWVKDCKVEACLDKFFMRMLQLHGQGGNKLPDTFSFSTLGDGEKRAESLTAKTELLSDLKAFIPDYFSAAGQDFTEDDKFKFLIDDLEATQELWENCAAQKANSLYQILEQLESAVEGEEALSVFTCGGSIAIESAAEGNRSQESPDLVMSKSAPVSVCWWSSTSEGSVRMTSLPPLQTSDIASQSSVEQLVSDCTQATFGRGNKDVLDKEYRCAGKLDAKNFLTSFHPADFGILDTIEQVLLPSINSPLQNDLQFRRVRAELYKLNVYSGPSGIFKKHVDTPRSPDQFGSLVVCFPCTHKGGSLTVSHNGQRKEFDWEELSASNIQWAAFYSDCEHEINRVSEGHRITLTYNLYVTEPVGIALLRNPVADASSLPLYAPIKYLFNQPGFFKDGGVLGFYCSYSYPHASDTARHSLPRQLKGSDLAIFAVLQSLGFPVAVLPVLRDRDYEDCEDGESWDEMRLKEFRKFGKRRRNAYRNPHDQQGEDILSLSYRHLFQDIKDCDDINVRWKRLFASRYPKGRGGVNGNLVGTGLHSYKLVNEGGYDGDNIGEILRNSWPHRFFPGITWVNSAKHSQLALTHLAYGNEASLDYKYSHAAIFAVIPPWCERNVVTA